MGSAPAPPGPPGPSWLKPLPLPERNGTAYPTQPQDHGLSAEENTGTEEVEDTESQAAPPGAMHPVQNPKETYA